MRQLERQTTRRRRRRESATETNHSDATYPSPQIPICCRRRQIALEEVAWVEAAGLDHPSAALAAGPIDQSAYLQPGLDAVHAYDSNTISQTSSDRGETPESQGKKRKQGQTLSSKKANKARRVGPTTEQMVAGDADKDGEGSGKPKRVRTGCLTCRERHLKCDEGLPTCNNCKKSNRACKRGIRLNFIDTWAEKPPIILSVQGTNEWRVEFQDESREIASEYQGGEEKYRNLDAFVHNAINADPTFQFDLPQTMPQAPQPPHQSLPPVQNMQQEQYPDPNQHAQMQEPYNAQPRQDHNHYQLQPPQSMQQPHQSQSSDANPMYTGSSGSSIHPGSVGSQYKSRMEMNGPSDYESKDHLSDQDATLFMQVFVEEVGLWMDSMDPQKHFSRLLPFHALSESMLLNAFLACGARHLTLVNPSYAEEKALDYYDTATRYLLKELQNPNRDTVVCATTAVILNVYEIMSERALQRMNHIAGARALIKECGWDARAQGIGQACFWLNVGLEVLSCLHFNWQVAWDPDTWGVDMDFSRELYNCREETWTHRMLYLIAKVCNFRATIPKVQDPDPNAQQLRTQQRYDEWLRLKNMIDAWNDGVPRTMHPMAYLHSHQTNSKSLFPEVWLIKRSTIVARLFYHTALLLMAQINPYFPVSTSSQMSDLQAKSSLSICGIVAHVKDRGVASVALRSMHHAAEVLTKREEQEEVLQIFDKINKETGWRIGFVYKDLKEKWGWTEGVSEGQFAQTHTAAKQARDAQEQQRQYQEQQQQQAKQAQAQQHQNMQPFFTPAPQQQQQQQQQNLPQPVHPPAAAGGAGSGGAPRKMPQGIPNPMYAKADFNLPQHPYQNHYVAPNHIAGNWGGGLGGILGGGQGQGQGQGGQGGFYG